MEISKYILSTSAVLTKTAKSDLLMSCANAENIKRYVGSKCYIYLGKYIN